MHRGAALVSALALLLACAGPAPSGVEAVLAADRERIDAMVSADPARLEACLHESLSYTHSTGVVDTRDSLIADLVAGKVDYRAIEPQGPSVRIRQGTGIVNTPVRMQVAAGGEAFTVEGVYTAIYQWESGRWQLVAYHSSPRAP